MVERDPARLPAAGPAQAHREPAHQLHGKVCPIPLFTFYLLSNTSWKLLSNLAYCWEMYVLSYLSGLWIRIHFFRIRIQSLMLETNTDPVPDPDPDPIRIQGFNDQKLEKNYSWKFFFIFFYQKLQFTYP